MDVLLRQLRPGPDGAVEYQDTELTADELSVGSAADCSIQLLGDGVAARHATLRGGGGQSSLSCRRGCEATVNGSTTAASPLKIGDVVEIGGHRLTLVSPPSGFELAIEIEANPRVAPSAYERAFRTDLDVTWLSKRKGAWLLAALVLLFGLILPYANLLSERAGAGGYALLPTDRVWTAGPLTPAHQVAAGLHCSNCHRQEFVHVRDVDCRRCHKSTADHVTAAQLAQTRLDPPQRCAQCHREHHAPATGLVIGDDRLCVDCHGHSDRDFGRLKLAPVSGFSLLAHPPFSVTLIKPTPASVASGQIEWAALREPLATAREQSNLKFSHVQHLDPAHVTRTSDGAALGCSDCHVLAADGEHFIPVTMQRSCAGCHELTFDPDAPDRQLPHGRPRDAILLIQDYFVRQGVDPTPAVTVIKRRRLPDQRTEEIPCSGPALACAMRRAQGEIENQFERHGCVSCHVVTDTHAAEVLDRFAVTPVRLTRDYFPDVRFSHSAHAVQNGKSGDAACQSCHAAGRSSSSADLLLPNLAKCLDCHSERLEKDRVVLQCVSCHRYHPRAMIAAIDREGVQ